MKIIDIANDLMMLSKAEKTRIKSQTQCTIIHLKRLWQKLMKQELKKQHVNQFGGNTTQECTTSTIRYTEQWNRIKYLEISPRTVALKT